MTTIDSLDDAQLVLLIVQHLSDGDLAPLQAIASNRKDLFDKELAYRLLLTFTPPAVTNLPALLDCLQHVDSQFRNYSSLDESSYPRLVSNVRAKEARQWSERMMLDRLWKPQIDQPDGLLDRFIISWLHQIEVTTGALEQWLPLVSHFAATSARLDLWTSTYLKPVIRLQYDFYPTSMDVVTLQELENIFGVAGVDRLLTPAVNSSIASNLARDIDQVVAPWVQGSTSAKRLRVSTDESPPAQKQATSWQDVNEWIYQKSATNFIHFAEAAVEWSGPAEIDEDIELAGNNGMEWARTLFAMVYAYCNGSEPSLRMAVRILEHAISLAGLESLIDGSALPDVKPVISLSSKVNDSHFFHNALNSQHNPLTSVDENSASFLQALISTSLLLAKYKIYLPVSQVAKICLFGSALQQQQEFIRVLTQIPQLTALDMDWVRIRSDLLWLHTWQNSEARERSGREPCPTFFARLDSSQLEEQILDAMLAAGQYGSVEHIYTDQESSPISRKTVEQRICQSIFNAYDNATNGNRTRGGVKKASETLQIFRTKFPDSKTFKEIDHLIKATHSLSFYQLTLQHGVPFQPVNIRVHHDPVDLIAKVLEQDARAYTKLDDLQEIGRHLVLANLPNNTIAAEELESVEKRVFDAEHRITFLAIKAALSNNDFDTAYSYITTRLSISPSQNTSFPFTDDTSWRAAYLAGKHRPASGPKTIHARIADLAKRMDLLSLALTLAPLPESLPEILGTWRRCEEEMDNLKGEALNEERSLEMAGSGGVPGGFGLNERDMDAAETKQAMARRSQMKSGASYEEEAPLGLFDVAKGAANALRKSAFPLRGSPGQPLIINDYQDDGSSSSAYRDEPTSPTLSAEARTRKRDMVSNVVKGGLGWMLGVPGQ